MPAVPPSAAPPTAIHRLVDRCRAREYPGVIARLDSGWAVMGERQVFAGYCLLLADPVVAHLNELQAPRRGRFLAEMALLGDVLLDVTQATRINYALFGNVEPALHAHLFPRHASEPEATRAAQPWALDWQRAPGYSDSLHGDLRARIGAALDRRASLHGA